MDLRQMRYFVTLCQHGQLARAAEALFITPQALSKSMRGLENELHAELFYRRKEQLHITEFGELLLKECTALLKAYGEMEERLRRAAGMEKTAIRVVFAHGLTSGNFGQYVLNCEKEFPGLSIDYMEMPDRFAERCIHEEDYDLAFLVGPPDNWNDLEYSLLQHFKMCAVVSPEHPFAKRRSITLGECAGQPLVGKNNIFREHSNLDREATRQNLKLSYILRSPNEIAWRLLIEGNEGVGIGTMFYRSFSTASTLVCIPFEEPALSFDIYMARRKDLRCPAALKELMDRISRKFTRL